MPDISFESVQQIHDRASLFAFLRNKLSWDIPLNEDIEDLTFDWAADQLKLPTRTAERLSGGTVLQLRAFDTAQPWGIFIVEFAEEKVFATSLRQILRGLIPKRRSDPTRKAWKQENLLFISVTKDYKHINFSYFRDSSAKRSILSSFGWKQGDERLRTICEHNLPHLQLSFDAANQEKWLSEWRKAFDVEAVTDKFFDAYKEVFEFAESKITGFGGAESAKEKKRLFTQKLFNRILFIRFLERKGWLRFNGKTDYLLGLWNDYQAKKESGSSFYTERLKLLFFSTLNTSTGVNNVAINGGGFLKDIVGEAPFLNGGLFEEGLDDKNEQIKVPDSIFDNIIKEIYYKFNFTVSESTPLDIEVAVDPEMLGKVFEELVTDREGKGSYYTPRVVVSFMCREALKAYLVDVCPQEKPESIKGLIEDRNATNLKDSEAVYHALLDVKICDPACGSGAYLLGMMQELLELRRALFDSKKLGDATLYNRKLSIIDRNIYGVDIDSFATNIAMLRLWLSLVVDDDRNPLDDGSEVALPNLDFKIETGDSLLTPNPKLTQTLSKLIREDLANKKSEYLKEHIRGRKAELRSEVEKLKNDLRGFVKQRGLENAFYWEVEFPEVFAEHEDAVTIGAELNLGHQLAASPRGSGFDIVIANPPYGAETNDNLRHNFFDQRAEGSQSKDTYGIFMARALQLGRHRGIISYIISDTWRTIKSHKPLRAKLLRETEVLHIIDLPSWIFKAAVQTCVFTSRIQTPISRHFVNAGDLRPIPNGNWQMLDKSLLAVSHIEEDIQTTFFALYHYPQHIIASYQNLSFFIGLPSLYSIMSDDRLQGLGAIADVKVGLQTGDNGYYLRKKEGARGSLEIIDEALVLPPSSIAKLTLDEKTNGIDPANHRGKYFLPYDKGGASSAEEGWLPSYHVPSDYFIDWSKRAIRRLKRVTAADVLRRKGKEEDITEASEKKIASRFQNREYYFKEGITFSSRGVYSPTFRFKSIGPFDKESSCLFSSLNARGLIALLNSKVVKYIFRSYIQHTFSSDVDALKEIPILPELLENEILLTEVERIVANQETNPNYSYYLANDPVIYAEIIRVLDLSNEFVREIDLWYCRRYPILAEAQGLLAEVKEKYSDYLAECEKLLEAV